MSGVNNAQWSELQNLMEAAAQSAKAAKSLGVSKANSPDEYLEQIATNNLTGVVSKPLNPMLVPSLSSGLPSGSPLQNPLIIQNAYDDIEVVAADKVQAFVESIMIMRKEKSLFNMWKNMTAEKLTKFLYDFPGVYRFLEKISRPEASSEVRFGVLPVEDKGSSTDILEVPWNSAGSSNFANVRRSIRKYYCRNNRWHPPKDEPLYLLVVIDMTNKLSLVLAVTNFHQGREVTDQLMKDRLYDQFICIPGGDGRAVNMRRFFDSFTSPLIVNSWPLFEQSKYKVTDANSVFAVSINFKYSIQKAALGAVKSLFEGVVEAAKSTGLYLTLSFTPGVEIGNADHVSDVSKALSIREKLVQKFNNVRVLVTSKGEESYAAYIETDDTSTPLEMIAKRAYQNLPPDLVRVHLMREGLTTHIELTPPANQVRRKFLI